MEGHENRGLTHFADSKHGGVCMPRQVLLRLFFTAILVEFLLPKNVIWADEIPSCTEVARSRSSPGASPSCAPRIVDNDAAFQAIRKAEKINSNYYVFMTEREWQSLSYKDRWSLLALVVSGIQSLYDANSEVFFC